MKQSSLAQRILSADFGLYQIYPAPTETLDRIWAEVPSKQLEDLVLDSSADAYARMIACEVFWSHEFTFFAKVPASMTAGIYAEVLRSGRIGFSNPWGNPWDGEMGEAGVNFYSLREGSVSVLIPLLGDTAAAPGYIGSEIVALAESYQLRIKDFAAMYLARIQQYALPWKAKPEDRDAEIAAMRLKLGL